MATRRQFKMTTAERRRRHFSDSFKIQKVREIETGKTKVSEISKQYEVTTTNVYRWLNKFGTMKDKKEKLIIETDSDTRQLLELKKKVAELERIIGQKQILIDFKDKMIELAEETYGVDIKKKFSTRPSNISGTTENNTDTA
ncbi:transposase [Candidatus Sulfidibacterium hydrothermale]|uniref:transposase n=1 Tax=Candidatus Sulfidibacterium hydrothermale TaxID=2875962 RepID=UPI001F0A629B|nr:transposase [Candidatus Sulfidibacterium hydrothermale]UBM61392.1 transposase [Candidatus Sulfidibacterium hydrothermale]UBM61952.1 transposase [Candidatus Sulfidibacterium hydrothermale]UBM62100.1 transposase [Candidatus Sulfidibacterium hydrothermale]UBM62690.1 transposase [Candidatus Sulfidibacterium hydrothermale]UBM62774.1 transposase [Candidatus Sulfidibacterium hydrothermale]